MVYITNQFVVYNFLDNCGKSIQCHILEYLFFRHSYIYQKILHIVLIDLKDQ